MALIQRLKIEPELPVYILGLTAEEEWFNQAIAEEKIRRVVKRALGFHPYIQEVRIRIEKQRERGGRTRYEVKANVFTQGKEEKFFVQQEGWDLLQVFDQLTEALDKVLMESKTIPTRVNRYKPLDRRRKYKRKTKRH
jgi:hypothetical protein